MINAVRKEKEGESCNSGSGFLHKGQGRRKRKCVLNNNRTQAGKTAARKKYKEAHKAMRKSIREDQERSIEGLAQEGEGAATKGNIKQFYDTSKKLIGKY